MSASGCSRSREVAKDESRVLVGDQRQFSVPVPSGWRVEESKPGTCFLLRGPASHGSQPTIVVKCATLTSSIDDMIAKATAKAQTTLSNYRVMSVSELSIVPGIDCR